VTSLLLVEDDRDLAAMLERVLVEESYDVSVAYDGQRALHLGLTRSFDLLVLDRGLPAIEGLDLLSRLRAKGVTSPVLVLSARATAEDRVEGLDAGAEDYLTKPFDLAELLARLRALLRRHQDRAEELSLGRSRLQIASRVVVRPDGQEITLSERECALLMLLAARPGHVFGRRELLALVFEDAQTDAVVETYVHYLRRKLGRGAIRTVRGVGYRFGEA
jgi:two-component system response regulator QseB